MLNVTSSVHWSKSTGEIEVSKQAKQQLSLVELLAKVDRYAALPALNSYGDDIDGHHAWFGVVDHGFILHAYFGCEDVDFELYGPVQPGQELSPDNNNPFNGNGLSGTLSIETLKQALRLLNESKSPKEYVLRHATEVEVVEDEGG